MRRQVPFDKLMPLSYDFAMLPAHQLLNEIITSLQTVIAPAIPDPYPKAQAFMAAVVLEFVSRQVEERHDIVTEKGRTLDALFTDLSAVLEGENLPESDNLPREERLCRLIEWLYGEKDRLGPEAFSTANQRIREALRQLLNEELKIAGKEE